MAKLLKTVTIRISDYTANKLIELWPGRAERADVIRAWLDQLVALRLAEIDAAKAEKDLREKLGGQFNA